MMDKLGLPDRFWNKVDIRGEDECWEWQASKHVAGYGWFNIGVGQKIEVTHRVVAGAMFGDISDLVIRHKCDNPSCVNPNHLETGTHADNSRDRVDRNRQAKGEKQGRSKLTSAQVTDIFTSGGPSRSMAKKYNISEQNVCDIRKQRSWKWLTDKIKPSL